MQPLSRADIQREARELRQSSDSLKVPLPVEDHSPHGLQAAELSQLAEKALPNIKSGG
jgi:hypothetical protein